MRASRDALFWLKKNRLFQNLQSRKPICTNIQTTKINKL